MAHAEYTEYTATNVIPPIGAIADVKSLPLFHTEVPNVEMWAKISQILAHISTPIDFGPPYF